MPEYRLDNPEKKSSRKIELTLTNKEEEVKRAADEILRVMKELGWNDEDILHWTELGLSEGLTNAIFHGNMGIEFSRTDPEFDEARARAEKDPRIQKKKVRVSAQITEGSVFIAIQDEGGERGREMAKNFGATDPTANANLLKPSGRGVLFMNAAFPNGVKIEPNDLGAKLTLARLNDKATAAEILDFWKGKIVKIEVNGKMEDGWEVIGAGTKGEKTLTVAKKASDRHSTLTQDLPLRQVEKWQEKTPKA